MASWSERDVIRLMMATVVAHRTNRASARNPRTVAAKERPTLDQSRSLTKLTVCTLLFSPHPNAIR